LGTVSATIYYMDVKTKIIATIGPATLDYGLFEQVVQEGTDFIRINTAYGSYEQYDEILDNLSKADPMGRVKVVYDIKKNEVLDYFVQKNLYAVAISFTETAEQIEKVRELAPKAFIISKVESVKGVDNYDEILSASDGIMVARGDLSVAVNLEKVPPLQKSFIQKALKQNKFTIAATEMLLSMVAKDIPTNAEVSDVANAVFDGVSAVMLSEETAIGKFPVEAVRYMRKTIKEAERWSAETGYFNGGFK
jgi:pyruvate kinase